MSLEDAFACMHLLSISSTAVCCKRLYLLCLCVPLTSMFLGTVVWAIVNFNASKAFIPLVVAIILLSMAEGALVLATLQAINKKPLDYELQESANLNIPGGPVNQALIHPAFRDFSVGSLNGTRNFSIPRERCLDISPPADAPAIPVPAPYVATGMISRSSSICRPLPPLPVETNNVPAPPPQLEGVNDMAVLPLSVHKHESAVIDTAAKPGGDAIDVESIEKAEPKPGTFDETPAQLTDMSMAEQIITGVTAEHYHQDDCHDSEQEIEDNSTESPNTELQAPHTPARLVAPAIVIQQPTPTTPKSFDCPSATFNGTSTIRLISPFLEIPAMTGHGFCHK